MFRRSHRAGYTATGQQDPSLTGMEQPYTPPARKKLRVFMWFFLAVQAVFVIWLIAGLASKSPDTAQQAASYCRDNWQTLYPSYSKCVSDYGSTLAAASDTGGAIGAGLIIALWAAVDVILGIGRLMVVFARRK